jgi:hypothetical protein
MVTDERMYQSPLGIRTFGSALGRARPIITWIVVFFDGAFKYGDGKIF